VGLVTGATDHARSPVREPVHAHHHRRIAGEDSSLDVKVIAIVGEDLGDEDRQGGIHIGRAHVHAHAHPFAGAIVCPRGDAHLAMSVVELDMGEGVDGLGLGVTRCGRVGRDRGLPPGRGRGRGRIRLIQGTAAGVGRGQLAEGEGASVISGIAGQGRLHNRLLLSLLTKMFCNLTDGNYHSQIKFLRNRHIKFPDF